MDWNSLTRYGWKLFAFLALPLLIIGIVLVIDGSRKGEKSSTNYACKGIETQKDGIDESKIWPSQQIPYEIDPILIDTKLLIRNSFNLIHDRTCIRFIEKQPSAKNWITFVRNDDVCILSDIGKDSSSSTKGQEVQLGMECLKTTSNIQRVLGRVLGLGFEETRPDREKFVHYNPLRRDCIEREEQYFPDYNIERDENDTTTTIGISNKHSPVALGILFDYQSHMFLAKECFTPHRTFTIRLGSSDDKNGGVLSILDLEKLNAIYNCTGCNSYRFVGIHQIHLAHSSIASFKPIEGGFDVDKQTMHICRVYHQGSLLIGKMKELSSHTYCWVSDQGKEHFYSKTFEILTNPQGYNFTWADTSNSIPRNAIAAGHTNDRDPLYIGKCTITSSGRTSEIASSYNPKVGGLFVPFGGNAIRCATFQLLTC